MATYQVDSEAVIGASVSVNVTIENVQSEVATLLSQLTALEGQWVGIASNAFTGIVDQWRQTQRQVEENLREISRALSTAGSQYAEVESANARMFAG